ncbi:MAG: PKD domain-containing protein, partial [Lewinellaceae bacterium]|nr:PKD domain-containing protein [Lewinellaceae bacterium]
MYVYFPGNLEVKVDGEPRAVPDSVKIIAWFTNSLGEKGCAGAILWKQQDAIMTVKGQAIFSEGYGDGEALKFWIEDSSGCIADSVAVSFAEPPMPLYQPFSFATITSIEGFKTFHSTVITTPDTCNANTGRILIGAANGIPPYSAIWDSLSGNGLTQTGLSNGGYSFTLTDASGCAIEQTATVAEAPCPLLLCNASCNGHPSTAAGCAPFQVNFADASTAEAGIQSWAWDFGDGDSSTDPNPTHLYEQAGTFTASLTISDGYQTDSKSFEITVYDQPIALPLVENDVCSPNQVSLLAESTDEITTWNWVFADGQELIGQQGELEFDDFNTTVNGTLYLVDARGCANQVELTVEIPEAYDLSIGQVALAAPRCQEPNGSISLSTNGGLAPYTFSWAHDNMLTDTTATELPPGNYAFTLTDANGCSRSMSLSLEDNTEVPEPVLGEDRALCENAIESLDAGIADGSFQWFLDGQLIEGTDGPALTPAQSGAYQVQVTNGDGCTGSDEAMVTLLPFPFLELGPNPTLCP